MPWYTNPATTCKVLNRIADRHPHATLTDLKTALDNATDLIWNKREQFYNNKSGRTENTLQNYG
jgi:hypothetical protein